MDIVSVHVEVYAYADLLRIEGEGGIDLHVELQILTLSKVSVAGQWGAVAKQQRAHQHHTARAQRSCAFIYLGPRAPKGADTAPWGAPRPRRRT